MIRRHLKDFTESEERNLYDMKVKSMSGDTITISILGHFDFVVKIINDKKFLITSSDEFLKDWNEMIDEKLKDASFKHIGDLLDLCSSTYTEMPEDENSSNAFSPLTPIINPDRIFDLQEDGSMGIDDNYDEIVCDVETLRKLEKQKEVLAKSQLKKVDETKSKLNFENVFEKSKQHEIKLNNSKLNNKDVNNVYIMFFADGFVVGTSEKGCFKEKLRSMKDPLLESLKKGFVPIEIAKSKEVDVHFIHKSCKYEDRWKEEKKRKEILEETLKQQEIDLLEQAKLESLKQLEKEKEKEEKEKEKKIFTLKDLESMIKKDNKKEKEEKKDL